MLTNKNLGSRLLWICALVTMCLAIGCTPPGPKALLEGKQLMDAGKWDESIPRLQEATELLATNALSWSYLAMAYHQVGQLDQSFKAYQVALKLDHTMVALHYNLGCLYLDMNNLNAAIDELRAFSLIQPTVPDGWVKLGTAQLRARRLDDAEKSFKAALALQARNAEALNGEGMVQAQRHRWQEAVNYFNTASTYETNFAPAVLNSAVIYHQYLNNRPLALQQYRRYLDLNPSAPDEIRSAIAQLERELQPATALAATPAPPVPSSSRAAAVAPAPLPRTNLLTTVSTPREKTNKTERTERLENLPRQTSVTNNTATALAANTTAPAPAPSRPSKLLELIPVNRPMPPKPVEAARSTGVTNPPATVSVATPTNVVAEKPPALDLARVQEDVVIRPAQDVTSPSPPVGNPAPASADPAARDFSGDSNQAKKGFFSRLNPFSRSNSKEGTGGSEAAPTKTAAREIGRPENLPEAAPVPVARYKYLAPQRPGDGNRENATLAFKRGIKAHRSGDRTRAAAEYQSAVRTDPGFFDAYYNLGLVALDSGDARLSLWAYELALSIQPDSADARYNLALALKAGGYALDAAHQLDRLLKENANDSRAHLSLGNLYAQQLKQPARAREHYKKVLELNPKHPEAATIRYWLAANP